MIDVHAISRDRTIDGFGIGDTLLVCTVAEGLRVENPGREVRLNTIPRNQEWARLFWGEDVGLVEELPDNGRVGKTDLFPLDDRLTVMDHRAESRGITRHQYCADNIGVKEPRLLPVTIAEKDRAWARQALRSPIEKKSKILGIAPMSRGVQRHWPMPYWIEFIGSVSKMNFQPIILGERDRRLAPLANISFFGQSPGRVAALLERCDLYIGPDSGLAHLAGLMEIPAIVICSVTVGQVVFGWYRSVHTVQIPGPCTGCMARPTKGFRFACATGCSITYDYKPDHLIEEFTNQFSACL